jgi:hypothetical protein
MTDQSASHPPKKAPVFVTGGGGFDFENKVAARFLVDMLLQANSFGADDLGPIVQVDWQVRDQGWLADDLAVASEKNTERHIVGVSIKSGYRVSTNGFPGDFADIAWLQWRNTERSFQNSTDAIALVTGDGTDVASGPWNLLLRESLVGSPERISSRVANDKAVDGIQIGSVGRSLFHSLQRQGKSDQEDAVETAKLLRKIRWLNFNFEKVGSSAFDRAISDCQRLLISGSLANAASMWDELATIAGSMRPRGGTLDIAGLVKRLRNKFSLVGFPDHARDWKRLYDASSQKLDNISNKIGELGSLTRTNEESKLTGLLRVKGAAFITGQSGSGKSSLAKAVCQSEYGHYIWLDNSALNFPSLAEAQRALALNNPIAQLVRTSPKSCMLICDALENYSANALKNLARLLAEIGNGWSKDDAHILLTAQAESVVSLVPEMATNGIPVNILDTTEITAPSEAEIRELVRSNQSVAWLSYRPELRSLLANLKILDWFVRAVAAGASVDAQQAVNLTSLIDLLWSHLIQVGEDGFARTGLLKRIGVIGAERLSADVALTNLNDGELRTLEGFKGQDLVRFEEEKVRFAHDLLGDWARLKVLIGDPDWFRSDHGRREKQGALMAPRHTIVWTAHSRTKRRHLPLERGDAGAFRREREFYPR